jgi:hypothetical protein
VKVFVVVGVIVIVIGKMVQGGIIIGITVITGKIGIIATGITVICVDDFLVNTLFYDAYIF